MRRTTRVRAHMTAVLAGALLVTGTAGAASAATAPVTTAGVGAGVTAAAADEPAPEPGTPLADVQAAADLAQEEHVARYVVAVYQDLFGRRPDPTGLDAWTRALLTGTPRVAVANGITASREFRATLVAGAYDHYLGRGPDPQGLEGWLAAMGQGLTIARIEAGFIASDEYFARSGSTFEGWVRKLYLDVLDRGAAPAEVQAWVAALRSGGSRTDVALGFLLSTEHLSTVVDGYYQHLLGRGLDPEGRRAWVAALQSGTRDEAIIGGIIASQEYWDALSTATGIALYLVEESVGAGAPVHPWVYTVDRSGQPLEHVTRHPGTAITIDGVRCADALCPTASLGTRTVTATHRGWTDTAQVTVVRGAPARLTVSIPPTVVAGVAVPYTVRAFDAGGNALGDVTSQAALTGVHGGTVACGSGSCRFLSVGTQAVTAVLTTPGEHVPDARSDLDVDVTFPAAAPGLSLYGWGGDSGGVLPVGGATDPLTPTLDDGTWSAVTAGQVHTVGLRTDGTLWEWGDRGTGCPVVPGRPTLVAGTGWTWVEADGAHTVALRADGTLWGWGDNSGTPLGSLAANGGCVQAPAPMPGGGTWRSATTGRRATYAIKADGTLWGWGGSDPAGLGDGAPPTPRPGATQIGTERWTDVSAGGLFTGFAVGVREDGTLWQWGAVPGPDSAVPVQVGTDTDWATVEAGLGTAAAIKQDGSLWVWGQGHTGLLAGADRRTPPTTLVQVGAGRSWVDIELDHDAALAIADDGTLWGWGDNVVDQLHNGGTPVTTPVQIAPGTTWSTAALGLNHALGLR